VILSGSVVITIFKPPPPVGAGGGYMFSGRPSVPPSVRACVRQCVRDSRGSFLFPRYLQYLLTDFRQTFVTGASWDTDDLITFLGQKVKVQGHKVCFLPCLVNKDEYMTTNTHITRNHGSLPENSVRSSIKATYCT